MLDFNQKMIKVTIAIALVAVLLFIMGSINIFKESYYDPVDFARMQWDYLQARIEYASQTSASYIFFGAKPTAKIISRGNTHAQSVPVLVYHGAIRDSSWLPDEVNVKLEDFKKQMFALKKSGYRTATLEEYFEFMEGKRILPEKTFLLTFDDARKDSFYPVDPILKALNFNAVMFVITNRSLGPGNESNHFHLSEKELRGIVASGRWDIASHGKNDHNLVQISADGKMGHFMSNKIWLKYEGRTETDAEFQKRISNDLFQSKKELQEKFGIRVRAFAYPFGDFGLGSENFPAGQQLILEKVQEIYPYSFYQKRSSDFTENSPGGSTLQRRIVMNSKITPPQLMANLANSRSKTKQSYADDFLVDHGWQEGWGTRIMDKNLMLTGANPVEDSSLTFLDGTSLWKNYIFKSRVQLVKGGSFAVLARYKNGDNYLSCDFDREQVAISQKFHGQEMPLVKIDRNLDFIADKEIEAGVIIQDGKISCLLDGKILAEAFVGKEFDSGGIGFKTWDASLNNSSLIIKQISVDNITVSSFAMSMSGILAGY